MNGMADVRLESRSSVKSSVGASSQEVDSTTKEEVALVFCIGLLGV